MALIGSWGPLVFEVSGEKARTFNELTQKSSGRWSEHAPINTPPLSEFLGPGLDQVDLKIIFAVMLGVNPRDSYELMRAKVRSGENYPLILQGIPLSGNNWYCEEISGTSTVFRPGTGAVMWMEMTASFKEYH
jgi:phage protein U